jgi:hypothetical protein
LKLLIDALVCTCPCSGLEPVAGGFGAALPQPRGPIGMPKECVWPANPCKSCGARVDQGKLCADHMQRVQAMVGTLECAWPGCPRRAWDRNGTCSFHRTVAWGLISE